MILSGERDLIQSCILFTQNKAPMSSDYRERLLTELLKGFDFVELFKRFPSGVFGLMLLLQDFTSTNHDIQSGERDQLHQFEQVYRFSIIEQVLSILQNLYFSAEDLGNILYIVAEVSRQFKSLNSVQASYDCDVDFPATVFAQGFDDVELVFSMLGLHIEFLEPLESSDKALLKWRIRVASILHRPNDQTDGMQLPLQPAEWEVINGK